MVKKIGILTSGGDSQGMNATLLGAIRTGCRLGKEMYVVYDGYKGLIDNNFVKVGPDFMDHTYNKGGTVIKTKRLPEFKEESVRKIIDIILNTDKDFDRVKFEEKIAITLACKMSINRCWRRWFLHGC